MKINIEVDIFEDPEYCEPKFARYHDGCRYKELDGFMFCTAFLGDDNSHINLDRDDNGRVKKCEPCKKAYKEAMNET